MAPFRRRAVAKRHEADRPFGQTTTPRRIKHFGQAAADPRDGQLLRGLVFGMPIGIAIWLLLVLTVWKLS